MYRLMIGQSRFMDSVYAQIDKAARTQLPVLIVGETGTGKELTAEEIHRRSPRAKGPFVAVNTGVLRGDLLYSELFGHRRGAFTGATHDKDGRFKEANGGTLFLDEIASAGEDVQIALLRVLETHAFRPLGAMNDQQSDARIVTASNVPLEAAVERGVFREDLMYRLNVLCIELPPLRARKDDIPVLAHHFLQTLVHEMALPETSLSADAIEALLAYRWPGNVRELKNALLQAAVIAEGGVIEPGQLPDRITSRRLQMDRVQVAEAGTRRNGNGGVEVRLGRNLSNISREYIQRTLRDCGNNKTRAAEVLGISRRTLYAKLADAP
jgi:DNA-binding NtrC family response regulator